MIINVTQYITDLILSLPCMNNKRIYKSTTCKGDCLRHEFILIY